MPVDPELKFSSFGLRMTLQMLLFVKSLFINSQGLLEGQADTAWEPSKRRKEVFLGPLSRFSLLSLSVVKVTEKAGSNNNTSELYSGGTRFESGPTHRLSSPVVLRDCSQSLQAYAAFFQIIIPYPVTILPFGYLV